MTERTTFEPAKIELEGVTASRAPIALSPVHSTIHAGVTAVLGTKEDGAPLLFAVLSGRERVRRGKLRLLGRPLDDVRRAIAYVPQDAVLPRGMRVGAVLELAAQVRGERAEAPRARLDALGIGALVDRRAESLSVAETRAVALAEALTSTVVRVLLVEEPFQRMDQRALPDLSSRLRACGEAGACVVFSTASPREARELATNALLFERGTLVRQGADLDAIILHGRGGVTLHVVSPEARSLGAALSGEQGALRVTTSDESLTLEGADARSLADAVARAARASGAEIVAMRMVPLSLDELRAAHAGDLAGAHEAARRRAEEARVAPRVEPPAPAMERA